MSKIKAYTRVNNQDTHYFHYFEVVNELPKLGDRIGANERITAIQKIDIDVENSSEAFEYDYYRMSSELPDGGFGCNYYFAIRAGIDYIAIMYDENDVEHSREEFRADLDDVLSAVINLHLPPAVAYAHIYQRGTEWNQDACEYIKKQNGSIKDLELNDWVVDKD